MGLRLSVARIYLQRACNAVCNAELRCIVGLQRVATGFATRNGWDRTSKDRLTAVASSVAVALQDATGCNASAGSPLARVSRVCGALPLGRALTLLEKNEEKEKVNQKEKTTGIGFRGRSPHPAATEELTSTHLLKVKNVPATRAVE